jgi:hypothetical protein
MTVNECPREDQIVHAVLSGAWPTRSDDELAAHASNCEVCAEVLSVATLLRADHEQARHGVHVPAAGQVWWRAAVRARLETAQAATQPMTWLHGVTAAMTIGLALAAIGFMWPSMTAGAEWLGTVFVGNAPGADLAGVVIGAIRQSLILAIVAGACLLLAPIALYFALSDD